MSLKSYTEEKFYLMSGPDPAEQEFLNRIKRLVEENISDEKFGVSELASKLAMSRSNLLRKLRKLTGKSVSLYIRQIRLEASMELLKEGGLNISEVAFRVGFNSTSYFTHCFREFYGFPPGETGKREKRTEGKRVGYKNPPVLILIISFALLSALFSVWYIFVFKGGERKQALERSIAVLPFKNNSNDTSNSYFIDGLMESLLNDLQKIEDLRVVSRSSVEHYRGINMTIPEIARELNVKYIVEGSGQKTGNRILLNIQLIEAETDRQLWAGRYQRDLEDIFSLQLEVAKNIASGVRAVISRGEASRIGQKLTSDMKAFDLFLQGRELLYRGKNEDVKEAISLFGLATERDPEFAMAWASSAIAYFLLDVYREEKLYLAEINACADKALFFNPVLAEGLAAKALFYIDSGEYENAVTYLSRALEYNPNAAWIIHILSDIYTIYLPDTEKYLEYALKGIRIEKPTGDSASASISYLHIANAFIQSGFTDEAREYINRSIAWNPGNLFSEYVGAYIAYTLDRDLEKLKESLLATLRKDNSRLDVLQEVAKSFYFSGDYPGALKYYSRFIRQKDSLGLNIFPFEYLKIAMVYRKSGLEKEAEVFIEKFLESTEQNQSIYRHLNFCVYYAYRENEEKALEEFRKFSEEGNYHYWTLLFLRQDPVMEKLKNHPDFIKTYRKIEMKFQKKHESIRRTLKKEGLLTEGWVE